GVGMQDAHFRRHAGAAADDEIGAAVAVDVTGADVHTAGESVEDDLIADHDRTAGAEHLHFTDAPRTRSRDDVDDAVAVHIAGGDEDAAAEARFEGEIRRDHP